MSKKAKVVVEFKGKRYEVVPESQLNRIVMAYIEDASHHGAMKEV